MHRDVSRRWQLWGGIFDQLTSCFQISDQLVVFHLIDSWSKLIVGQRSLIHLVRLFFFPLKTDTMGHFTEVRVQLEHAGVLYKTGM